MSKYVFVGTNAEIWDTPYKLSRFGQVVEMPDDVASTAIKAGCALLKQADFDLAGFTPDELKRFSTVDRHKGAPEEFLRKRSIAWKLLHGIRPQVEPKPEPQSAPAKETTNTVQETK